MELLVIAGGIETMTNVPMGGFNVSFNRKLYKNPDMPDAWHQELTRGLVAGQTPRG